MVLLGCCCRLELVLVLVLVAGNTLVGSHRLEVVTCVQLLVLHGLLVVVVVLLASQHLLPGACWGLRRQAVLNCSRQMIVVLLLRGCVRGNWLLLLLASC